MVVVVDYFTKWVEVEALVNITAKSIEQFLWKNVVCHYGIPHAFITDNEKHFNYDSFWKWCAELHIRNYFSSHKELFRPRASETRSRFRDRRIRDLGHKFEAYTIETFGSETSKFEALVSETQEFRDHKFKFI